MGLRIISEECEFKGGSNIPADGYVDRLKKYIPSEAVTFWLTVSGMIQSSGEAVPKVELLWFFFLIGLMFAFGWTYRYTTEPGKTTAWTQIVVSSGAFIVWVFSIGGALTASVPFYQPLYGSLLLITYTTAVAFIVPMEE
jgi:hypothetical protein